MRCRIYYESGGIFLTKSAEVWGRPVSRRAFTAALLLLLAGVSTGSERTSKKELLRPFVSQKAYLDWGPPPISSLFGYNIHGPRTESADDMARRILGFRYVPAHTLFGPAGLRQIQEMYRTGAYANRMTWENTGDPFLSKALEIDPVAALVHGLILKMEWHGIKMVDSQNQMLQIFGFRPDESLVVPIQQHIYPRVGPDGTPIVYDERGNIGIGIYIDPFGATEDVKQYAGDKQILNFSGQFGAIDIFCEKYISDGQTTTTIPPRVRIDGAYKPHRAKESASGLAYMARMLSWMNVYAATGNEGDQPFGGIEQLKEEGKWSDRILMQNEAFPVRHELDEEEIYKQWNGTLNKDISVNTVNFNQWWGSSGATNIISTYADILLNEGVFQEEINSRVYDVSRLVVDTEGNSIHVIDSFDSLKDGVF